MRTIALIIAPGGGSLDTQTVPATITIEDETYYLDMTAEIAALLRGRAEVRAWVDFDGDDVDIIAEVDTDEDEGG